MKRITHILLAIAITATANAQNPNQHLQKLALNLANATNLIYTTCPELDTPAACIIATGNKELDKHLIDRHFPDLILNWDMPWISANPQSYGRAANTIHGQIIISTMQLDPTTTWIIIWYAY